MVGARHLMTIITQGSLAPTLSSPPSTRVSRLTKFSKFKKKQRFGLQPSRSLKAIETKRRVADNLEGVANDWNEERAVLRSTTLITRVTFDPIME